jgi:hypothetical protein
VVFGTFAMILDIKVVPELLSLFPLYGQIDSLISTRFSKIKVYHLHFDKRLIHHLPESHSKTDVQIVDLVEPENLNIYLFIVFIILVLLFFF